jgi:Cd2+/Zn2+-exporting ATPase
LAAARLGIALGTQASDTALETADVVILSLHVRRVADLVRLGRRTRRLLSQNIALALILKIAVLLLAADGLATLWMAVAADVGASLVVIFNGMRLLQE